MKLFNSLTRKKESFVPHRSKKVTIYVCGITPYDTTHLGHAFTYIWFDVLVRYLTFKGYKVKYTQNVTDINDRDNDILKKALEQNVPWQKLGDFWTKKFLDDMKALNWTMPTNYLKASENIQPMINLIQKLIGNGCAYSKNGSVYFDIEQKKDYGKLSDLRNIEMLKIAKDFEEDTENPDKKNPLDITLWRAAAKNQPPHIPSFESPFGPPAGGGRAGWHIGCSSMSMSTPGEQIDIHGGGIDLIYPHHEAEIAQSEGATLKIPFARFWMHAGLVSYQGKKMAKSSGNLVLISGLLKKFSANAIRFALLSHHYRESWEFEEKELNEAEAYLTKLKNIEEDSDLSKFTDFMDNDLQANLVLKNIKSKTVMRTLGFMQ